MRLFLSILSMLVLDQSGTTLSLTRHTSNTLITAAAFNSNYDGLEAVINGGIDQNNIDDDAVTAAKLNSDVVRSGYGLSQHTDGSLQFDPSDTNPCLEITDGGVRVKVDGTTIERAAGGLQIPTATQEKFVAPGITSVWWTDTPPTGWLLCDGSAVSRTTYSTLFALLGTVFGVGDGSTTFNLPSLKGRIPVGKDSSQTEFDTLGETGGAKTHTHTGAVNTTGDSQTITTGGGGSCPTTGHGHTFTTDAGNSLQPYIVANYIIKT